MTKLVIVESPTKAKTISKFLGSGYKIESSFGHIRDLPKSKMGVDVENNFAPTYVIPKGSKKRVSELKKLAAAADEIVLATDEDREGEAIAWHLVQALGLATKFPSPLKGEGGGEGKRVKRIVFHEITKSAIEKALAKPRRILQNLVDAQQTRRILDRLVGYELSPFLWSKVRRGLSAGRVQSVAVRLIAEREREIEKFSAREFWSIEAKLHPENEDKQLFCAKLHSKDGRSYKKFDIPEKKQADEILKDLKGAKYQVTDIRKKETKRNPAAPFTTSTLQQEAARKLGFSAKQTMMFAQKLYETGLITYMRTDSVNLAAQALAQAKEVIEQKYGKEYARERRYKTKSKGAQEAHEAIRPTDLTLAPAGAGGSGDARQERLYDLVWKRTVASQMAEAIFDNTSVDIKANSYVFRATGQVIKFDGFIKVYQEGHDENGDEGELPKGQLPELAEAQPLKLDSLDGVQHFTQPPARFTDASLVKVLEEYGIGRPSTYAPTISTIINRGYVEREEKKFKPTEIGLLVNDMLVEHFPKIVDYEFTAHMESELDEVAAGALKWQPVIKEFYEPFKKNLEEKKDKVEKRVEQTDIPCPKCGKLMVKKFGRFGAFLACSDYPNCKGTKPLPEEEAEQKKLEAEYGNQKCPECGAGNLVIKRGRFGPFLGCSRYPECRHIGRIEKKTGVKCEKCGEGELVEKKTRKGRIFWGCNKYPKCENATWKNPALASKAEESEQSEKTA